MPRYHRDPEWGESHGLEHHCAICKKALKHPTAMQTCIGKHVVPCWRLHGQLFRVNTSQRCKPCGDADERHQRRHQEIARTLWELREPATATTLPAREPLTPLRVTNILSTLSDQQTCDSVDENSPSKPLRKREKKEIKRALRAQARVDVVTMEEVKALWKVLHPDYEESTPLVKEAFGYHFEVFKQREKNWNSQVPDFSPEVERILLSLKVTGQDWPYSKSKQRTLQRLRDLIKEDLVQFHLELDGIFQRGKKYLEWTSRSSFENVLDQYQDKDWKTGAKITTAEADQDLLELESETSDDELKGFRNLFAGVNNERHLTMKHGRGLVWSTTGSVDPLDQPSPRPPRPMKTADSNTPCPNVVPFGNLNEIDSNATKATANKKDAPGTFHATSASQLPSAETRQKMAPKPVPTITPGNRKVLDRGERTDGLQKSDREKNTRHGELPRPVGLEALTSLDKYYPRVHEHVSHKAAFERSQLDRPSRPGAPPIFVNSREGPYKPIPGFISGGSVNVISSAKSPYCNYLEPLSASDVSAANAPTMLNYASARDGLTFDVKDILFFKRQLVPSVMYEEFGYSRTEPDCIGALLGDRIRPIDVKEDRLVCFPRPKASSPNYAICPCCKDDRESKIHWVYLSAVDDQIVVGPMPRKHAENLKKYPRRVIFTKEKAIDLICIRLSSGRPVIMYPERVVILTQAEFASSAMVMYPQPIGPISRADAECLLFGCPKTEHKHGFDIALTKEYHPDQGFMIFTDMFDWLADPVRIAMPQRLELSWALYKLSHDADPKDKLHQRRKQFAADIGYFFLAHMDDLFNCEDVIIKANVVVKRLEHHYAALIREVELRICLDKCACCAQHVCFFCRTPRDIGPTLYTCMMKGCPFGGWHFDCMPGARELTRKIHSLDAKATFSVDKSLEHLVNYCPSCYEDLKYLASQF